MQFVDRVRISVESGSGGDGMVAWRREKFVPHGGPAGGDGGQGGDVILEATPDLHTLLDFKYQSQFRADDGERGRSKNQHGKSGKDLVIRVPCGTIVRDSDTKQAIADLVNPGDRIIVAFGGRGGRGNSRFTSSRRQAPQFAEPGESGIKRELDLELKLIAEVGIIGLPNAGKSTLISVISAAKPKIADYPFTTLVPNLGVVRRPSGDGVVVADIPGLVEGASQGVGLGHEFLRHVERTRLLLHLVECQTMDGHSPLDSIRLINHELQQHSPLLAKKPQMIVITKLDLLPEGDANTTLLVQAIQSTFPHTPVLTISAVTRQGLDTLLHEMFAYLDQLPAEDFEVEIVADPKALDNDDSAFEVIRVGKTWRVIGGKLDRLVRVTDFRNTSAVRRLTNIFKAMGVYRELAQHGVKSGETVVIGGQEFDYYADEDLT